MVEYARSMPIPGVPQDDNYEQLLAEDKLDWKFVDDRYDNRQYINKIETKLADHHILILETAQDVIEGNITAPDGTTVKRCMFFMPPGSAKSTYVDVVIPTWVMGKYPGNPIILTSYADMLAKKHGKRARQVCMSPEYQAVFGSTLDPKTGAADQWALLNGSEYLAAGLQSGLTGNRAFGAIVDDPIKGRQAAESLTQRQAMLDAYKDDFRTRKIPSAWEIIIQTRWHEEDLAGWILPEDWKGESGLMKCRDGYWWQVVCVQAECETDTDPLGRAPGQYIWEEWFHDSGNVEAYWAPFKLDTRSWTSLYQQIPTPPGGTLFKQDWVKYYDGSVPEHSKFYISADYAVTAEGEGDDPDLTSIGVWALSPDGLIYFVDGWHGKVDAGEWTDIMLDFVKVYKPMFHIAGGGPIRRGTEFYTKRRMRERKTFVRMEWQPETHGKIENARPFQAAMENDMVRWPRTEEAEFVLRHLVGFGTLRYDDPVDMCAMMGQAVAKMWEKKPPSPIVDDRPTIQPGAIAVAAVGAQQLKGKIA